MNYLALDIGSTFLGNSRFLSSTSDIGKLVSIILSLAIAVAGIVFLFLLILGGISIIAGAGSDNPQAVAKGKAAATSAIIGFIIVFAAYWIVKLIEAITGLSLLG